LTGYWTSEILWSRQNASNLGRRPVPDRPFEMAPTAAIR
jgi:hypothetical protein